MRLGLIYCFLLLADIKSKLLEISIIGFGQLEGFVECEHLSAARLHLRKGKYAMRCDEYASHS